MNDILDIEIILKKQKYHPIYNIGTILLIIILIFIYVSFLYNYKTYYITMGTIKNNSLELLVSLDDIKYISSNNVLKINDKIYSYHIDKIEENLYVDESFNNYKYMI